jgi:hypothetical protein
MPGGDRDHIGCFADQVTLTHALVWDLDEAVKEVKLLGEHEESSQKITELEALCKRLREDAQKLKEEKTTLEGMIFFLVNGRNDLVVDVSYAARQAHRIINVALHREYSLGIVFIFSQGRKNVYHV